jgi:hypothetical protein
MLLTGWKGTEPDERNQYRQQLTLNLQQNKHTLMTLESDSGVQKFIYIVFKEMVNVCMA